MKRFMVISSGIKNGEPRSTLVPLIEGKKENGDCFAFFDKKAYGESIDRQLPIGSIHFGNTNFVDAPPEALPTKLKLSSTSN